jgi:hypothetical protein
MAKMFIENLRRFFPWIQAVAYVRFFFPVVSVPRKFQALARSTRVEDFYNAESGAQKMVPSAY